MNSRFLNKVTLQSLRQGHQCRYISIQQNINKCSITCQTVNFHRKKENRSPNFIFTSNRTLCQPALQIHTSFQRNLSVTSRLHQAASVEQLKKAVTDVATATADVTQNVAASVEQVKKAVEVAPPTGNVTESSLTWVTAEVAESPLIEHVQQVLVQVHEATGLPWWASIALSAFFLRATITLPFAVTQARLLAKLEGVSMSMGETERRLRKESVKAQKEYGWPEKLAKQKFSEARNNAFWNLVKKENCHPVKAYFLVSIQGSLWVTATVATASLCNLNAVGLNIYNQMTTGGFGWVKDLTVIDPYLILPISLAILNLCIVEVHQGFKVDRTSHTEQWKMFVARIMSLGMIPLGGYTPAAVNIYWLGSSTYGLVQALLLNTSLMRRLFRIPMNDPELKHPYRYFMKNMQEKLRTVKKETAIAAK